MQCLLFYDVVPVSEMVVGGMAVDIEPSCQYLVPFYCCVAGLGLNGEVGGSAHGRGVLEIHDP